MVCMYFHNMNLAHFLADGSQETPNEKITQ